MHRGIFGGRVIKHYTWHVGTWAWVLNRLAGLGLIFYLVLHIFVIHYVRQGPDTFDALMGFLNTPIWKFLEWGLFGIVLYHSLNGLRIVMIDLGWLSELRGQKAAFWVIVVIGLAGWLAGGALFLMHAAG
jgi:succinate dehydrogenase / fumarate reductase cytochrome b subunit